MLSAALTCIMIHDRGMQVTPLNKLIIDIHIFQSLKNDGWAQPHLAPPPLPSYAAALEVFFRKLW